MQIQEVKLADQFFKVPDQLGIEAEQSAQFSVSLSEDGSRATVRQGDGGEGKEWLITPGASLTLCHKFKVVSVTCLDEATFPLKLKFKGSEYTLRDTKNSGLLLNK